MKTLTSSNKIWASKCKSLSIIHRIALSWLDSTPELRVLPGSVHRFPWKHRKPKSKAGPLVKLMKFQFEWRDNVSWATTWPARAAWEIPRSFRALATPGKFINFLGRRRLPYFSLIFPRQCWVTSVAGPVFFWLLDGLATTGEFMMKWVVSIMLLSPRPILSESSSFC